MAAAAAAALGAVVEGKSEDPNESLASEAAVESVFSFPRYEQETHE